MAKGKGGKGFLSRLLPGGSSGEFFDLLEQHAAHTREAAQLLHGMVHDGVDPEQQNERVKHAEHQGDEVTHTVIERLHQTFITPIDRDDLHRLISRMDDVLDLIYASSERLWLYGIRQSEPEARDLTDVLVKACEEMQGAVRGLRDLRDRQRLIGHCTEINRLENEADHAFRSATGKLFREEPDTRQLIKFKEIYEMLEETTDRCEDVANIIEGIVLEYA